LRTKLVFLGAARAVTGSRYYLEANGIRLLVDCGLYQERQFASRNWEQFPVSPDTLHAVLVTHAHLDHCGLLPKLVREGFRGKLYCTEATAEIVRITLMDSAHIQEEDAAFKKRRHEREGRVAPYPEIPLYTVNDAQACFPLLEPIRYGDHIALGEGISATFHEAGHVLGSSMVTLDISESGDRRRILFSGDIGRWGEPILQDPTVFSQADYILVESTYGDRLHETQGVAIDQLAEAINSTIKAGGNVIVPSFALERSQEVLYYTNKLLLEGRIPRLRVFLDSPMAVSVTEVFKRHPELFDREMTGFVQQGNSPFNFRGLSMVTVVEDSKAISDLVGPRMIIAGSGMCNAGRVKHHLVNNISNPKNAVLFVGFQAVGTLGWQIMDGAKVVRILGQNYPVRAKIVQIHGFSAHADRDELLRWLSSIRKAPDQTFVVHGEEETSFRFADLVRAKLGWGVTVPEYRQEVMLE